MNPDFHVPLVRSFLLDNFPLGVNDSRWSTQGFGMARIYLDDTRNLRLNIWHSALAVPGLSPETGMVHTHPWDFTSRIIAGRLSNYRYRWESVENEDAKLLAPWRCAEITPGPGGSVTGSDGRAIKPSGYDVRRFGTLVPVVRQYGDRSFHAEHYRPGGIYSQSFDEIHHTEYEDGTVTINRRDRGDRPDRALTFWKARHDWISAEPNLNRNTSWSTAPDDVLVAAVEAALEQLEGAS